MLKNLYTTLIIDLQNAQWELKENELGKVTSIIMNKKDFTEMMDNAPAVIPILVELGPAKAQIMGVPVVLADVESTQFGVTFKE